MHYQTDSFQANPHCYCYCVVVVAVVVSGSCDDGGVVAEDFVDDVLTSNCNVFALVAILLM